MQPKKTPLFVPVLWFFVSIIWAYTFGMSVSTGKAGFGDSCFAVVEDRGVIGVIKVICKVIIEGDFFSDGYIKG